jgi:hypothetical protein
MTLQRSLNVAYQMMNLSKQDQRHIKGPMLLDLKPQKDKVNENHYCKTLQKLLLARDSTLSSHNKLTLYKLLIRPILTYAAPVWSNTSNTNYCHLQTLQSKCLRVIGNYPRRTHIPLIHSTLNIETLHEFKHHLLEKIFHQCSIHQNPLVHQIGDYTMADLQHRYKKYIHKRTKHLLL